MKQRLRTASSDDKLPEDDGITVKLRIHARTKDLDVTWAKDILGLSEDDPAVKRLFAYRDEGVVGCDFRNGEKLVSLEDVQQWQRSVFRVATEWLRTKSKDQFRRLKDAGARADLFVSGYEGYIPKDLLKEIVRLEIDLLMIGKTRDDRLDA
jgi:hypothetical protein